MWNSNAGNKAKQHKEYWWTGLLYLLVRVCVCDFPPNTADQPRDYHTSPAAGSYTFSIIDEIYSLMSKLLFEITSPSHLLHTITTTITITIGSVVVVVVMVQQPMESSHKLYDTSHWGSTADLVSCLFYCTWIMSHHWSICIASFLPPLGKHSFACTRSPRYEFWRLQFSRRRTWRRYPTTLSQQPITF